MKFEPKLAVLSLDRVYEHLELSWAADEICKQIYSEHITQTRCSEATDSFGAGHSKILNFTHRYLASFWDFSSKTQNDLGTVECGFLKNLKICEMFK